MAQSIQELIAARQAKAEMVVDLINQAAVAYKELHTSTGALGETLYRLNVDKSFQRNGKAPNITGEIIPGMRTLPERVKAMIDFVMFDTGRNGVDLVQCITEENAASLKEANK